MSREIASDEILQKREIKRIFLSRDLKLKIKGWIFTQTKMYLMIDSVLIFFFEKLDLRNYTKPWKISKKASHEKLWKIH